MSRVSAEVSGGVLTVAGVALAAYHLTMLAGHSLFSGQFLHHLVPPLISLGLAALGVELVRGRLVDDRYASRVLAWTAAGALALGAFDVWAQTGAPVGGRSPGSPSRRCSPS